MSGQLDTLLTEIICFLFGKKKKKKKQKQKKNETESRIFTRHFIVYNVISKLKCFGNRIVKTYDLISIADFAG